MKLISDDYMGVYVWVDDEDPDHELSPHFDYEDDAVQWYRRVQAEMLDKLGLKVEKK